MAGPEQKFFLAAANGGIEPKLPNAAQRSNGSNMGQSGRSAHARYAYFSPEMGMIIGGLEPRLADAEVDDVLVRSRRLRDAGLCLERTFGAETVDRGGAL